jgi:hypothetical protein
LGPEIVMSLVSGAMCERWIDGENWVGAQVVVEEKGAGLEEAFWVEIEYLYGASRSRC